MIQLLASLAASSSIWSVTGRCATAGEARAQPPVIASARQNLRRALQGEAIMMTPPENQLRSRWQWRLNRTRGRSFVMFGGFMVHEGDSRGEDVRLTCEPRQRSFP